MLALRSTSLARTKRAVALFLALATSATVVVPSAAVAQTKDKAQDRNANPAAKAQLEAGERAMAARDYEGAIRAFESATSAGGSAQQAAAAALGVASALDALGREPEAYEAYDALLKEHRNTLARKPRADAEARLRALAQKTGYLSLRVREEGAAVEVDGKPWGLTPVPARVRVAAGPHRVRVQKSGFVTYDETVQVEPDGRPIVAIELSRETNSGRLVVREKRGEAIRVQVDGIDVGPAPWQGDLAPGPHDVAGRGGQLVAPQQRVEVEKGKTTEVELEATPFIARLEVRTSDGKGFILLDGKPVAEGEFAGDVSVGPHVLEVAREGYERYRKEIVLQDRQTFAETVTLKRLGVTLADAEAGSHERSGEGVYGGFGLVGGVVATGLNNELELRCARLGAHSCTTPSPLGGGVFGYLGYGWNPIGLEFMLGGLFDSAVHRAKFDGVSQENVSPLFSDPARDERFLFLRLGGLGAARARFSLQTRALRVSAAVGVGLSYKIMQMERRATATDGSGLRDPAFVPDSVSYLSPGLSFDLSAQWRLTPTVALALGMFGWLENAGSDTRAAPDPNRVMVSQNRVVPIHTPGYQLASATQLFLGPYLGMQFGP